MELHWYDTWLELLKVISLLGEDAQTICLSILNHVHNQIVELGRLVSLATLDEQSLYEIADPNSYISPDIVCDFSDEYFADRSCESDEDRNLEPAILRVAKYRKRKGALPSYRVRFNGFPWRDYIPPLPPFPQYLVEALEDSDDYYSYYSVYSNRNRGLTKQMKQARARAEEKSMTPSSDASDVPLKTFMHNRNYNFIHLSQAKHFKHLTIV